MEREYHSDAEESDSEERTYDEALEYLMNGKYLMSETHGDVVQCDECEQWVHMNCVGLSTPPNDNWLCSLCKL